MQHFRGWK